MDIYLHIGYPKTGSSAIQAHVSANRGWFLAHGVYIPSAGYMAGAGHSLLLPQIVNDASETQSRNTQKLEELSLELSQAEQRGFQKALISWEGFSMARDRELTLLGKALGSHRVIILAYVREQGALIQSTILQHIERLRFGQGQLLLQGENVLDNLSPNYDYYSTLDRWRNAFSNEVNIRTRLFDRSRLLLSDVVQDFLDWLDLLPDDGFRIQSSHVNTSLDFRSAALLSVTKANGQRHVSLVSLSRALVCVVQRYGAGSRNFLSTEQRQRLWLHYERSNRDFFHAFRPENAAQQDVQFDDPGDIELAASQESEIEFYRNLQDALDNPTLELWQGNVLSKFWLTKIASAPNAGWGGASPTGVWSKGQTSELAFLLPETDALHGPQAIELVIAGDYYGDNGSTVVEVGGQTSEIDLSSANLRIELDDATRENGIHLTLRHNTPQLPQPGDADPAAQGIAFKLQYLSYNFLWPQMP